MENLGFLENSRICKNEEERFPLGALYKGRNLVGVNPLEVQKKKKETESYRRDKSRPNSNETLKPLDPHRIIKAGNMDP